MRTEAEISVEIKKVSTAREAAEKKIQRCDDRLAELKRELQEALDGRERAPAPDKP